MRHGLEKPVQRFATSGAIAANRIVLLGSDGYLALAGTTDANAIGVTVGGVIAATQLDSGPPVTMYSNGGGEFVEVAGGVTITRGAICYQAAAGKLADTGTVRAGIALSGGTAGQLVELLFC